MTLTIVPTFPRARGPMRSTVRPVQNDEASILRRFLYGMGYYPLNISVTNEKLEAVMRAEMYKHKIQCPQLERTLHMCGSFAEIVYNECTFEEKKDIALYTWYATYVDDMASRDVAFLDAFEQRFLRGQPQQEPVLKVFAEAILSLCDQYDTLAANAILTATLEFINSSRMEHAIESAALIQDAGSFPWYLRDQTGIGKAYAFMLFPKSKKLASTDFMQALSDMNYWISATNDLLSFHKEELAGEETNYIHNRAYVENNTPMQVFADMGCELLELRASILAILAKCPRAAETWQMFERGYIMWHLDQDRYKLRDLGL